MPGGARPIPFPYPALFLSNSGTLEQAGGGDLIIEGPITNTGTINGTNARVGFTHQGTTLALTSTTEAINSGVVFLQSATILGGTAALTTTTGGRFQTEDRR